MSLPELNFRWPCCVVRRPRRPANLGGGRLSAANCRQQGLCAGLLAFTMGTGAASFVSVSIGGRAGGRAESGLGGTVEWMVRLQGASHIGSTRPQRCLRLRAPSPISGLLPALAWSGVGRTAFAGPLSAAAARPPTTLTGAFVQNFFQRSHGHRSGVSSSSSQ